MFGKRKRGQMLVEVISASIVLCLLSIIICGAFLQSHKIKYLATECMEGNNNRKNLKMYLKKNIERRSYEISVGNEELVINKKDEKLVIKVIGNNLRAKHINDMGRKLYETTLINGVVMFNVYEKEKLVYIELKTKEYKVLWSFLR